MRSSSRLVAAGTLAAGLLVAFACGRASDTASGQGGGSGSGAGGSGGSGGGSGSDGGSVSGQDGGGGSGLDGGGSGGQDGGSGGGGSDGGSSGGGGSDGGSDGGSGSDGGTTTSLPPIPFPSSSTWDFYGPQNGGPQDVFDAALDQGGNLWVAGGQEGLFLMRAGASGALSGKFEKFGIADGLHPYGWLNGKVAAYYGVPDGSPADTHPSLTATPVVSVAGGPAGTVFVGYQGKPGCEDAWKGNQWDPPSTWGDPSVYKSGDADRVALAGSGISVVHYDIFSGPGVVPATKTSPGEPEGREKLCSIYRIVWNQARNEIWFGGNHGFAVGIADAPNTPTCNGEYPPASPNCSVVWEHSHPAISGCSVEYNFAGGGNCPSDKTEWLTDAYFGVAVDPVTLDMWMGGANRTTMFFSATKGDYYAAHDVTEAAPGPNGAADRWDLWPDPYPEWDSTHGVIYLSPSMRDDDVVSGIGALGDGTAFVGSFAHGLLHINSSGGRIADVTGSLNNRYVSAVASDPSDASIWVGMNYGPGVTRLNSGGGKIADYFDNTFGSVGANTSIPSIQGAAGGRMVVSFRAQKSYAGAVGIYQGP